ncbi:MAG TPA: peptide chain release factor N(5)-glutamine methyltransferase [Pseudobdellovibrionaceae bacterium]|jgi:release factor glutamine methyltransferase
MKLKEVLDKTTQFFKDKNIESPRLDAELLLAHGLKLQRIQLYLKFDQPLTDGELVTCRELVRRRALGEPVAYILGVKDFYGFSFQVNSAVLIPRPETEHLVEAALEWVKEQGFSQDDHKMNSYNIVDLGSGSGCIGLTLLKKIPQAKLVAVDISEKALEIAKVNAEALEVVDRVRFVNRDAGNVNEVLAALKDFTGTNKIHILVSNPPYIALEDKDVEENVKKFEPEIALFAQENGLKFLRDWSQKYRLYLNEKAIVLMETGMTQGPAMQKHFEDLGVFNKVDVIKDLAGLDRVIRGSKYG